MRLLIVTHYYPSHRGGIEIVAGQLAQRFTGAGVDVTWAASDVSPAPDATSVPMRTCNFTERRLGFPYPVWSPSALLRLRGLINRCDLVHLHDCLYMGNVLAARWARQAGKPVVVSQHIGEVPYKNPVLRQMHRVANRTIGRRILGSGEQAVFYSSRVRAYFETFVRFRSPPRYLPNGVDLSLFRPTSPAVRAERPQLLFVGRFVEKKGLLHLRDVARQRSGWDFQFAGWGPIDPGSWGLANVKLLGSLSGDELVNAYRAADLLVLPSVGEGFPLVIQEAAACGVPALVSSETLTGHEDMAGFVSACEPNPADIIRALDALLADRPSLCVRGQAAAEHARQHWDWDRLAGDYLRLFEEVRRNNSGR